MKLKVRAVHGQLNDGGFDSQRYAIAQHQPPITGRFLQGEVSLNRIVASCTVSGVTTNNAATLYVERGYSWIRYGGTVIRLQRNQKYHA